MKALRTLLTPLLIACLAAAAGCRHHLEDEPVPPAEDIQANAESTFAEGLRLYEAGNYTQAEEQFLSPALWAGGTQVQLQALKYLAFSYCVSEQPIQCRFAFNRALQIDPTFHLGTAEASHPLWGPVFVQAAHR
ncbi:TssQ family T6SS-associated lipoprotein [Pseudomonas sp. GD04087]|uniref:TssQ family T6SS-associated lipoprotein n=1 Tax=unclassified Pseudomonas TaxID=196821 RepID=UPI0024481360|nr:MULTISPECIES: TssQ family T6SS-associated lipoprotein [unclassified Pseudomonas]MDH0293416.1 TssQ family T6SS-associated lipoprotein [Pseudomonas sp. GD04087]MDH1053001.1 TssQ family T6SS-associated lipoprotein [Pseudomonas sp. GD03903]MDH2003144.1 TssQ family T6SS-associated lipoprotein [Pseudomonas sp. GD03691]